MRITNDNTNMPINCGMKGMHEGIKEIQADKNNGKAAAVKETQKLSVEKHKGNHIDYKL
jgi:hypothetical protein